MSSGPTKGGNIVFRNINNDYLHIPDPNERRRLALAHIDQDSFGWNHVRAIVVAGIGFFTDAYGIFAINSVIQLLGIVYWAGGTTNGVMPVSTMTAIKVATPVGTIIGQVVFGVLADKLGRRKMYGIELIIIILTTFVAAVTSSSLATNMLGITVFLRIVLGIGIGGDYPLSAIITSEFAPAKWRGVMMAAVFSMQGFGQLAATLVSLIVVVAFKSELEMAVSPATCAEGCRRAADRMWRITVGCGALPACAALYYRITIPETPRYTFDIARDIYKAEHDVSMYIASRPQGLPDEVLRIQTIEMHGNRLTAPRSSVSDFCRYFGQWKNGKILLGTAASWFFLDIAFYGLGLNDTVIQNSLGFASSGNLYMQLRNHAVGMLILACAGALPGYWVTIGLIDVVGRKPIQIGGFVVLGVVFAIIGFAYNSLSRSGLTALFVTAQFFFNFGPNATTFIYPGECFPTRYRATSHGLSAAIGKVGAIVALAFNPYLRRGALPSCASIDCYPNLKHVMEILALFMFCGLGTTLLLPETKGRTLEDINGEDHAASPSAMSAQTRTTASSWSQVST